MSNVPEMSYISFDQILEKLQNTPEYIRNNDWEKDEKIFDDWNLAEKKKLLEVYLMICKKESSIFRMIYHHHGCDTWEDIFRDFSYRYLKDKENGVKIAIDDINYQINSENENENESEIEIEIESESEKTRKSI